MVNIQIDQVEIDMNQVDMNYTVKFHSHWYKYQQYMASMKSDQM